jgi:hypothetical protein
MDDMTLRLGKRSEGRHMPSALADFLAFILCPRRGHPRPANAGRTLRTVAVLVGTNALFALLVSIPTQHLLQGIIGLRSGSLGSLGRVVVLVVIVGPVIEELLFRAGLRSARWTLCTMPALIGLFFQGWQTALGIAAVTGLLLLADATIRRGRGLSANAVLRWRRGRVFISHYPLVVRGYALAFALLHIINFEYDAAIGWRAGLVVLAVSSQFVTGLMLSFLRLRFGLGASIVAHCGWNLLVTIVDALVG